MYSGDEASEAPGTVFTTDVGGVDTIWLIQTIDRDQYSAAYARVTPGHHAGTVSLQCTDREEGGCLVSVTYDMSRLPGSDTSALDVYNDESFAMMMQHWAAEVGRHLSP